MLPVPGVPANSLRCPQLASVHSAPSREATSPSPRPPTNPQPALVEQENCKDVGASGISGPVCHLLWPARSHWTTGTGGSHFKAPTLS